MLNLLSDPEVQEIIQYCQARYELSSSAWDELVLRRSSEAIWAIPAELDKFLIASAGEDFETAGLRILSGKTFPYKITDSFEKCFSNQIRKGIVELNSSQLREVLFEKDTPIDIETGAQDGYVILKYREMIVGVGLKRGSKLISQIPKKLTNQLSKKLEFRD